MGKIKKLKKKISKQHKMWNRFKDRINHISCKTDKGLIEHVENILGDVSKMSIRMKNNIITVLDDMGCDQYTEHIIILKFSKETKQEIKSLGIDIKEMKIKIKYLQSEINDFVQNKRLRKEESKLEAKYEKIANFVQDKEHTNGVYTFIVDNENELRDFLNSLEENEPRKDWDEIFIKAEYGIEQSTYFNILNLIEEGQTLRAIKLLSDESGKSLKESRDLVLSMKEQI